jgi:hypothetical protein
LKFLYESKVSKEDSHLDWLKFSSNFDSIVRWSILSCVKFVIYYMSMENCVFETWYELSEKCVCLQRTFCLSWVENSLNSKHYVDCCKPWRGFKVAFQEINEGTNERLVFDWCVNGGCCNLIWQLLGVEKPRGYVTQEYVFCTHCVVLKFEQSLSLHL